MPQHVVFPLFVRHALERFGRRHVGASPPCRRRRRRAGRRRCSGLRSTPSGGRSCTRVGRARIRSRRAPPRSRASRRTRRPSRSRGSGRAAARRRSSARAPAPSRTARSRFRATLLFPHRDEQAGDARARVEQAEEAVGSGDHSAVDLGDPGLGPRPLRHRAHAMDERRNVDHQRSATSPERARPGRRRHVRCRSRGYSSCARRHPDDRERGRVR